MDSTYRTMTEEHLGADRNDLLAFQEACAAVLPAFDNDDAAATDYVWNNGEFTTRLNAGACIYCGKLIADRTLVPAAADDEGWAELTPEHGSGCEWIATRAHNLAS